VSVESLWIDTSKIVFIADKTTVVNKALYIKKKLEGGIVVDDVIGVGDVIVDHYLWFAI
jgi:hypothetical protein